MRSVTCTDCMATGESFPCVTCQRCGGYGFYGEMWDTMLPNRWSYPYSWGVFEEELVDSYVCVKYFTSCCDGTLFRNKTRYVICERKDGFGYDVYLHHGDTLWMEYS